MKVKNSSMFQNFTLSAKRFSKQRAMVDSWDLAAAVMDTAAAALYKKELAWARAPYPEFAAFLSLPCLMSLIPAVM